MGVRGKVLRFRVQGLGFRVYPEDNAQLCQRTMFCPGAERRLQSGTSGTSGSAPGPTALPSRPRWARRPSARAACLRTGQSPPKSTEENQGGCSAEPAQPILPINCLNNKNNSRL